MAWPIAQTRPQALHKEEFGHSRECEQQHPASKTMRGSRPLIAKCPPSPPSAAKLANGYEPQTNYLHCWPLGRTASRRQGATLRALQPHGLGMRRAARQNAIECSMCAWRCIKYGDHVERIRAHHKPHQHNAVVCWGALLSQPRQGKWSRPSKHRPTAAAEKRLSNEYNKERSAAHSTFARREAKTSPPPAL